MMTACVWRTVVKAFFQESRWRSEQKTNMGVTHDSLLYSQDIHISSSDHFLSTEI